MFEADLKILQKINKKDVIEFLRSLIKIPSISFSGNENEKGIACFIGEKLKSLGLEVRYEEPKQNRVSVIATKRGAQEGPTLILNGHIDTKPATSIKGSKEEWTYDPFGAVTKKGKVFGLGASDMKGGVAAIVMAAEALVKANIDLKGQLVIQGVADEEMGSTLGMIHLTEKGVKGDMGIVAEPTELQICPAQLGALWLEIHTIGKRGHASMPWLSINANEKMLKIIKALQDWVEWRRKKRRHKLFPKHPTLNLGAIEGGNHPGVIPDFCKLTIDSRLLPGETIDSSFKEVKERIQKVQEKDPDLEVEYQFFGSGGADPAEISTDERTVKSLAKSYKKVLSRDAVISGMPGFTDARLLTNNLKIPTTVFGPGSTAQAHTVNEYVEIDQVVNCTKMFALTIADILAKP